MNCVTETLYKRAFTRYIVDADIRAYHNFAHANDVRNAAQEINGGRYDAAIDLAALYHDAVYIPGATGSVNEDASAFALKLDCRTLDVPEQLVNEAYTLIQQTSVASHMRTTTCADPKLSVLLDADLCALAKPYDEFVQYQHKIIVEYGGSPDVLEHRAKNASFLQTMSDHRLFLYHTEYARDKWERQAQFNISKWFKENEL